MYRGSLIIMVLIILSVSTATAMDGEKASQAIQDAENAINEMQDMGYGVTYANDTLREAKNLFDQGYYEAAEALAENVQEIKERATEVDGLINQVESKIYDLSFKGYDTSSVSPIFEAGFSEFAVDNYLDAEAFMIETLDRLDDLEAGESLKRIWETRLDLLSVFLDYLWLLIILFLFVLVIGFRSKEDADMKKWKESVMRLKEEGKRIDKSLADAQKKYFEKGSMSKIDYDLLSRMHDYRISLINRKMSVLKRRLKNH